jgi:hypothetical protein
MSLFHCSYFIKQFYYKTIFQAGQHDPCTWDVARLSSVKIHSHAAWVFLRFPKVSRHPSCTDNAILDRKPFGIPLIALQRFMCMHLRVTSQTSMFRSHSQFVCIRNTCEWSTHMLVWLHVDHPLRRDCMLLLYSVVDKFILAKFITGKPFKSNVMTKAFGA